MDNDVSCIFTSFHYHEIKWKYPAYKCLQISSKNLLVGTREIEQQSRDAIDTCDWNSSLNCVLWRIIQFKTKQKNV